MKGKNLDGSEKFIKRRVSSISLFYDITQAYNAGKSYAVVTIVAIEASTPREVGAKMLVFADGSIKGTVGGGASEYLVIREALAAIKQGKSKLIGYDLGAEAGVLKPTGAICGGQVQLFIEVINTPINLIILGAGHIGMKLSEMCGIMEIPHVVADDRAGFAVAENFPAAHEVILGKYHEVWKQLKVTAKSHIVIVTHGHSADGICLQHALKTEARYIGMIGSRSKIAGIFAQVAKHGIDPARDSRVFTPIGLDLGGQTPAEIALSIMAEIQQLTYAGSGKHMRDGKNPKTK